MTPRSSTRHSYTRLLNALKRTDQIVTSAAFERIPGPQLHFLASFAELLAQATATSLPPTVRGRRTARRQPLPA